MQSCVCFTICISISLFWLLSLINTTPRYLDLSTCCSVTMLTCKLQRALG